MPFLDAAEPAGLAPQAATPVETTNGPAWGDLLGAAFTSGNTIGSLAEATNQPPLAPENPDYDPFGSLKGYEDHASSFIGANTDEEVAHIKGRIDGERRRSDLLAAGGWRGWVSDIVAGIADPVNLIPVGGEAVAVGRGARSIEGALRVGRAGFLSSAAQQSVLQATQETHTLKESAINVAAGTLFAGVLGAAAGALSRPLTREVAASAMRGGAIFERELSANIDPANNNANPGQFGSVGAAARADTTLSQETLRSAFGAENALAFSSPTLRLGTSPSVETRRIAQDLAEQPLDLRKNVEGIETPISAETRIRQWQAPLAQGIVSLEDAFTQYRLGRDKRFGDIARLGASDLVNRDPGVLSWDGFKDAVGMAMRRGDEHPIPQVAEAARSLRKTVFDPLKDEAIKAGLLPEDVSVDTAASYLTRVYNTQRIAARRPEFEGRITDWLDKTRAEVEARVEKFNASIAKGEANKARLTEELPLKRAALREAEAAGDKATVESLTAEVARMERNHKRSTAAVERLTQLVEGEHGFARADRGDLQDIARQITDNLLHAAPSRTSYAPVPLTRGPLKERTLGIPDKDIEDFLESDVGRIARIYTRTMAPDVELAKGFGRADMADQLEKVREHYAVLRNGVTDEKALTKLDGQMKGDLRDLAAVRDRIRGTYGLPDNPNGLWNRAYHLTRDLNYLRLLGGMTISALPDLGRTVMVHGITRVVGDGLGPMLRDFHSFRLAAKEVKLAGTALDMVLDGRTMSLADVMDDFGRWSKFERGISGLTNQFGLVSLMAPWNAALKQFVGVVSQTRSLRAVESLVGGGAVSPAERTRLASLGISQEMAERINTMFGKHGEKSGAWWANTTAWEDKDAADIFRYAMAKEVDAAIVTPGQERPLWMTKGIGRVVGQFKSFSIASTQRVMLSGLQRRDMATLNGAILMTGLGSLSYYLKADKDHLPDPSTAAGLSKWISEGVDKSGLVGWLFDANNLTEKFTRGAVGLSRLTGQPMMSRYSSQSALSSILGPTVGAIEDTSKAASALGSGDWSAADTRSLRRMIPLQNLLGLRLVFDQAEAGVNRAFGIPTRH